MLARWGAGEEWEGAGGIREGRGELRRGERRGGRRDGAKERKLPEVE